MPPPPRQDPPLGSYHHPQDRGKLLIPLRQRFYESSLSRNGAKTMKFSGIFVANFMMLLSSYTYWWFVQDKCDVLHDFIPFVQFKKYEKHPWRNVTFSKPATLLKVKLHSSMGVFYVFWIAQMAPNRATDHKYRQIKIKNAFFWQSHVSEKKYFKIQKISKHKVLWIFENSEISLHKLLQNTTTLFFFRSKF